MSELSEQLIQPVGKRSGQPGSEQGNPLTLRPSSGATITGRRHDDGCMCGCQWVDGLEGELVQDSDTPKLTKLDFVYVRFSVPTWLTKRTHREQIICYRLSEVVYEQLALEAA